MQLNHISRPHCRQHTGSRGACQTKLLCVGRCVTRGAEWSKAHHGPDSRPSWFVPLSATTKQQEPSLGLWSSCQRGFKRFRRSKNTSRSKNGEKRVTIETKLCKETMITSAQISCRLPLNVFVYLCTLRLDQ